jgi:hypothetical protein
MAMTGATMKRPVEKGTEAAAAVQKLRRELENERLLRLKAQQELGGLRSVNRKLQLALAVARGKPAKAETSPAS